MKSTLTAAGLWAIGMALAGLLPSGAGGTEAMQTRQPGNPAKDPRSTVLIERRCASTLGETVSTLYGNGTVRRRETREGVQALWLGELDPLELDGFRRRLAGAVSSELDSFRDRGVGGDWIGRCSVVFERAEGGRSEISYGEMDSRPLPLAVLLRILDDLEARATQRVNVEELPADYQPRPGDILRRRDGVLFEVVRFTADKKGVELSGRTIPLTLYLDATELRRQFGSLVQRGTR